MNKPNIIDYIVISPSVWDRWDMLAKQMAKAARKLGIAYEQIGEEEAYEQEDGSLLITVQMADITISMRVPPKDWGFNN